MKKKLLFIVSSFNYGGAQKVISNITTSLPQNEYDVDILLNSDRDIQYDHYGRIISLDVGEPKDRKGIIYQSKVFIKRLNKIKKLKKENHYDCIVSILTSANVANVLRKTPDCRCVVVEVIMPNESQSFKDKYLVSKLTSIFYNRADCVVAETGLIAENLVKKHKVDSNKISIIPNSINVNAISEEIKTPITDEERKIFSKDKTFVTAGRIAYQKAHWHLIRAFKKVVEFDRDAKLAIFGEGELKDYITDLIRSYKLEQNVILCGFSSDLDRYIANSRAFVFPSMYEGMPTALLQALATGVPCIVTDFLSGAREILGDEDTPSDKIDRIVFTKWGIITPVCSGNVLGADVPLEKEEELLSEAMIKILSDSELAGKYGAAARERSIDFDNSSVIKKWVKVIENEV